MFESTNEPRGRGLSLRPIVSINLKESGCTMTESTAEDEKVTYELDFQNI